MLTTPTTNSKTHTHTPKTRGRSSLVKTNLTSLLMTAQYAMALEMTSHKMFFPEEQNLKNHKSKSNRHRPERR